MTVRKQANLLDLVQQVADPSVLAPFAASWAAGDTLLHQLRNKGIQRGPELFESAYQKGKEGKQINLHTQNALRTVLGRKTNLPAEQGARLGAYIGRRGFSPEEERRYLELLNEAARRNNRTEFIDGMANRNLHRFGKDHVDYAPHLDRMLKGDTDKGSLVAKVSDLSPDPLDKKMGLGHALQDVGFATLAPFTDFRMATRPAFKHLDQTKVGKKLDTALQSDGESKLKQGLRMTKDYIS